MNSAEVLIKFKGDTKDADSAIKDQESKLDGLKKKGEAAFAGITAGADLLAGSIVKSGITYNAQIETYLTRLETLTGSAEEAHKVLEQIKKDALATPFEVSSLTQAESLLLATGLSAEDARKDILALGDAISASGGGNEELQRMAVNLQQIKNVGKASALDIKQFAYAGIDIYGLLADSMGITRAEAAQLDVSYDMLSEALQKASSEGGKYYGAMEKQSQTYNGAMSNLSESLQVLKGELAKGVFKAVKKLIPLLTKMADWLAKNRKIVMAITVPLLTFLNIIMGFLIIKKITTMFAALNAVLLANPILLVVAAVAALVAGFIYLWNNCEGFRNFFINMWNGIKNIVDTTIGFIVDLFKGIIDFVKNNWQGLLLLIVNPFAGAFKLLYDNCEGFRNFINNFIDNIVSFFKELPGKIVDIIGSIPGKIKNAFTNGVDKVKEGASSIFNTIWDTVKGLPEKFITLGEDIVKGLWKGIKGLKNWLEDKAKNFFGGFVKGIKNVLGIHSPSVVMEKQVGVNLGLGVVKGLDDTQNQINKTIGNIASGVSASVGSNLNISGANSSSMRPVFNVYVDSHTDPLGQTVSSIKTFSGGAKNDYNYGVGV